MSDLEIPRYENCAINHGQGMNINSWGGEPVLQGHAALNFILAKPDCEFLSLQELRGRKIWLVFLRHFA